MAGKTGKQEAAVVFVHASRDTDYRLTFPKEVADRIAWLSGVEEVRAWLLLMDQGRFRILSDEQVENDSMLEPIRLLILEGHHGADRKAVDSEVSTFQALVARLIPINIDYHKQRRRIVFPRELDAFAPPDCDLRAFSFLLSLEGYWELWYTAALRSAVHFPIPLRERL